MIFFSPEKKKEKKKNRLMIKTSIVACQLTEKFEPRGSLKIETFPYGWMADLYLGVVTLRLERDERERL